MTPDEIMLLAAFGAGLLAMAGFAGWWLGVRKRRLRCRLGFGEWMNALGFGLLPALGVAKAFEQYLPFGKSGTEVFVPLPQTPWLTEGGRFFPARIEAVALLLCFAGMCLWLMLRGGEMPSNGDVLGTALVLWAAVRSVTEGFRADSQLSLGAWRAVYLLCAVAVLIWTGVWTRRWQRRIKNTSQAVLYWLVVIVTTVGLWAVISGTLDTGSRIGDFAAVAGCSALRAAASLAAGAESRRR